ncbi:MAG: SAM-dependent methyltransferase, partial [Spirulinaceae cyanobacterium RM2_2_10]|nr:SAM-dependent methyltransferase [Spirulinaceae cyanobacterium RM2_2_10]
FETWPLEAAAFDAVLAATSWHWIPAAISYPKAAAALKPDGRLILLWNKQLQPAAEIYRALQPAYERHAPHLFYYESPDAQLAAMQDLGAMVLASGHFGDLQAGHTWQQVDYAVEDYLALLTTYSPYLELAAPTRTALLADLRAMLLAVEGDRLKLTYLSAYQVVCRRAAAGDAA